MRRAGLVVPHATGAGIRFLRAALAMKDAHAALVSEEPLESWPDDVRAALKAHWRVGSVLDTDQLVEAAKGITAQLGGLDRYFAVMEHAQLPVALARATLGLPGLDPDVVRGFRDKALMKTRLREKGVPTARHALAHDAAAAREAASRIGFPLVVKPVAGAGAARTHRVASAGDLERLLAESPPRPEDPLLLEEFILGEEHSFDSVWVKGKPRWTSISCYRPSCIDVVENDWIQWTVLLPRSIDGPEFEPIREAGAAALRALGFTSGMSHMEWFQRGDGSVAVSEVGARPPGAQFTTLMGLAHDADLYAAWVRLMVHGTFRAPKRKFAAGAAYLRAMGRGKVRGVRGAEEVQREFGPLIAEAKWPEPGQPAKEGYEGQGYVLLRHAETDAVAHALRRIVEVVRVDLE